MILLCFCINENHMRIKKQKQRVNFMRNKLLKQQHMKTTWIIQLHTASIFNKIQSYSFE